MTRGAWYGGEQDRRSKSDRRHRPWRMHTDAQWWRQQRGVHDRWQRYDQTGIMRTERICKANCKSQRDGVRMRGRAIAERRRHAIFSRVLDRYVADNEELQFMGMRLSKDFLRRVGWVPAEAKVVKKETR